MRDPYHGDNQRIECNRTYNCIVIPVCRLLTAFAITWIGCASLPAQISVLTCVPSANPPVVRVEGITERVGDALITCSGGNPSAQISGNLTVFADAAVTNRLSGNILNGVSLTYDNGAGPRATVPASLFSSSAIAFNNVSFTLSATGGVTLRLSNLRLNVTGFARVQNTPLSLYMGFNPSNVLFLSSAQFTVAYARSGLYTGTSGKLIRSVYGSPAPDNTASFSAFISAGTSFTSTRLTEGFADAFQPATSYANLMADNGHRFLIHYSGFPEGSRLYLPDFVAGSDAARSTAGGDFGAPATGGNYVPSAAGSLLLSRVKGASVQGAGGAPAAAPAAATSFDSMSEVPLDSSGSGSAVYEVMDANNAIQESAQFPTFLVLARSSVSAPIETSEAVSFAAVSTAGTATSTDPIPRFLASVPLADCVIVGDCAAKYNPALFVDTTPLLYSGQSGAGNQVQYFVVNNQSGGVMRWTATIHYAKGSGWIKLYPDSGVNGARVRVDAFPATLEPGIYQAIITIDAGPIAGQKNVPVSLIVNPVPPPAITSVLNAASFATGPVSPGSLATLMGARFRGKSVSVTFDGLPATVLFSNDAQINVLVPPALAGKTTAQLVITVDGQSSAPQTIALAAFSPAIFPGGVLNEDNSVNSAANPAAPGSMLQIYATGLSGSGAISVQLNGSSVDSPAYAGPAPGLIGVQQVNELIQAGGDLTVCGLSTCSPPFRIYVAQPQK